MFDPTYYKQQTEYQKRGFECQISAVFQKVDEGKSNGKKSHSAGGIKDRMQYWNLRFQSSPYSWEEGFMADALTKEAQRLADQLNRLTQETCNYIMGYCV